MLVRGPYPGVGKARAIIGSLGFPSKMPGTSFGLPATACILGAKLAKIKGTSCSVCYALKDRYQWGNPLKAQQRRLAGLSHPRWIDAMVLVLQHTHRDKWIRVDLGIVGIKLKAKGGSRFRLNPSGYHRWHDSGDLQSVEHLAMICEVARRTPKIKHWLPTQELGMVWKYIDAGGVIPPNLVIRVSSIKIDDQRRRTWMTTSSVVALSEPPPGSHVCPAPRQEHRCLDCRACWSPSVRHVVYELH